MASKPSKLILFRGAPGRGTYAGSPFVTKLEFRFRHARLAYDVEPGSKGTAPKGKMPYVDLSALHEGGVDGPSLMGDSSFIIQHLVSADQLPDLNESLSDIEELNDLALRALLEDKLYFYHMRERWLENYHVQRDTALYSMPYMLRVLVGLLIHRTISSTLHGQGVGRLSVEEVRGLKTEIWRTIDNALGKKLKKGGPGAETPFWVLGGKEPTEADATLFGFVVSVLVTERQVVSFALRQIFNVGRLTPASSNPESQKLVKTFPTVLEYARRIHDRLFPDYERWT